MVDEIVDPIIRDLVRKQLRFLDSADPRKAFREEANLPVLQNRHGAPIPIRRVRVFASNCSIAVGKPGSPRHVQTADNHHLAIYEAPPDEKGNVKWTAQVVSLLEATRRKREGIPVVSPHVQSGLSLVTALYKGDVVEMNLPEGDLNQRNLAVVRTFSIGARDDFELVVVPHNCAGKIEELKASGDWIRIRNFKELRRMNPLPVSLTALGKRASDAGEPNS